VNTIIKKAVDVVGSQAALAKSLNVSAPFVNDLLHARKRVPAELCGGIENATQGAVTRYDLRPDVFGDAPVADTKKKRSA